MKHLKFKVQVTPEQSAKIQKAIFAKGGKWVGNVVAVRLLDEPFLVVRNGGISYLNSEKGFQNFDPAVPQWFAHNALERIRKSTSMHTYVVDAFDNVIAVRTSTSRDTETFPRKKITAHSPGLAYMWILEDTIQYDFTREGQPPLVAMLSWRQYPAIMERAQDYCDKLNAELNKEG